MHSLNQKSWQGNTILALLTLAVAVVAAMAVSDARQTANNAMPPPANRTISGLEVPDLSVSGFRVGSLAVFLVNDLFLAPELSEIIPAQRRPQLKRLLPVNLLTPQPQQSGQMLIPHRLRSQFHRRPRLTDQH